MVVLAVGRVSPAAATPSTSTWLEMKPVGGSCETVAAAVTPGAAFVRRINSSKKAIIAGPLGYFCCGSVSRMVTTPSGSKPRSAPRMLMKLRISRPAPSSSTTESAISATMSALRIRAPDRPSPVRPSDFKESCGSVRVA
jgi:hypothetical protein